MHKNSLAKLCKGWKLCYRFSSEVEQKRIVEAESSAKHFKHIFPTTENEKVPTAAWNIISHRLNPLSKSKAFLTLVSQNFNHVKNEKSTEYFSPPKVHENSIFLYKSVDLANVVQFGRGFDYALLGFVSVGTAYPLLSISLLGVGYYLWGNAFFYEMSRRLVVRMDLMPHLEMVNFQKVGSFGQVYNKLVRIEDLERVNPEEAVQQENYFWLLNKASVDKNMIFRDKSTGELFLFDRTGFWDVEGISHNLLN